MPEITEITVNQALAVLRNARLDSPDAKAVFNSAQELVAYREGIEAELKATAQSARATMSELQKANTDRLVSQFKREGKITPVAEIFARAILGEKPLSTSAVPSEQTITFRDKEGNESTAHFAELFLRFLEVSPPSISFQELTRMQEAANVLSIADAQFVSEKLGLDPAKVAVNMR
jgi:hypothetical protein